MSFLKSTAISIGRWVAVTAITSFAVLGLLWWGMNRKPDIPPGSTLYVAFDKPLVEANLPMPTILTALGGGGPNLLPVHDLSAAIRAAAQDPEIARLVLNLDGFEPAGMQTTYELVSALQAFQKSGKRSIAYASNLNRPQFMIANAAGERWLDGMGRVDFSGPDYSTVYIGELLKKAGVEIYVARAGEFKAAVEPLILPAMSANARAQYASLLSGFRTSFFDTVKWHSAKARSVAERNTIRQPLAATQDNVVTHVRSLSDLDQVMTPRDAQGRRENSKVIPFEIYRKTLSPANCPSDRHIAVLTLSGPIGMQGDPLTTIAPQATIEALRQVEDSGKASAIVLRIDSPGGDAQAAEMIRAEVEAIRRRGLPVVASLSNTAASGGYWIATAANEIIAGQFTLTGSIGAFAVRPSLNALASHYNVNQQTVRVGPEPLTAGFLDPISESQRRQLDQDIALVYDRFLDLVVRSRRIAPDKMPELAGGRVWTGPQALELKLVDKVATLDGAIARAAALGKTSPQCHRPVYPQVTMQQLLNSMAASKQQAAVPLPASLKVAIGTSSASFAAVASNLGRPLVYCLTCQGLQP